MSQNTNLLVCPNDWGDYKIFGDVHFDGGVQITHVDTSVKHGIDPSMRMDAHQGTRTTGTDVNYYRELDGPMIPVKVGDHIVMKVWIKTGHSTLGKDGVVPNGGLIGFDYYSAGGRLHEHSSDKQNDADPTWSTYLQDPNVFVPFNSDWTLRVIDTIVPSQCYSERTGLVETNTITGLIPWLSAGEWIVQLPDGSYAQDEGIAWFASTELYINPGITPAPVVLTILPNSNGTVWPGQGTWPEPLGTVVSIAANPASGYQLDHWIVDGSTVAATNPYIVTMNANHTVQPVFTEIAPVSYVVDIWAMNGGVTNPTGQQTVNTGKISITATPNQGYTFTGWLVNNQPVSDNPLTLTITGPTTVIPQFQTIPTFTLTIIPSVGGKTDLAGAISVKAGDNTVVNATADQGYVFDHWLFDGQDQTPWFPTDTFTLWNAQQNHTLQAVFTVGQQTPPTMAGSSTAFLLVLGGLTVGGLVIGLTRGKKRTQRRSK